jgi:hypothetical protein
VRQTWWRLSTTPWTAVLWHGRWGLQLEGNSETLGTTRHTMTNYASFFYL